MILPIATLAALCFTSDLPPAIVEAPRVWAAEPESVADLAHPSERARHERQETLEGHREWLHRRHVLLAEREAKEAAEDAPAPQVPMGPSGISMTSHIPIFIHVGGVPGGGLGGGPQQQAFSPGLNPTFIANWERAYGPFLTRMASSAW